MQLNAPGGPGRERTSHGWVFFAVPEEARPFRRKLATLGPNVPSASIDVLVTGMGAQNAERAFQSALRAGTPRPDWILTCGFAGGLNPQWRSGDLGYDADPEFPLARGLANDGRPRWQFHCAATVAITVAEKSGLRATTHADAVEMESGVLRKLARDHGIPSATLRVISDAADEPLPLDFNTLMTSAMTLSLPRLVGRLLGSPGKIPTLIRFGRQTQAAAEKLAAGLVDVLRA